MPKNEHSGKENVEKVKNEILEMNCYFANCNSNKLLKFAAKNAAGQLLAGSAKTTRNSALAER
jgi:hypothetical protein